MKRDKALLFQCLLPAVLVALAGLAGLAMLASARQSQQSKIALVEASRDPILADQTEWNHFYDTISVPRFARLERKAEGAKPEEAVPEYRAPNDVVNVPITSADQAPANPSGASSATTTSPVVPHSASSELAAKTDASSTQTTVLPDRPYEKTDSAAVPNVRSWDQEPHKTTPSVAASESAPPAVADAHAAAPVPTLDATPDKSTQPIWRPVAPTKSTPRAKVAAPVPAPYIGPPSQAGRPRTGSGAQPPVDAFPDARRAPQRAVCARGLRTAVERRSGSIRGTSGRRSINPAHYPTLLRNTTSHPTARNLARTSLTAHARQVGNDPARNSTSPTV